MKLDVTGPRSDLYQKATQYELACRASRIGVWELHVTEDRLVYSDIAREIFGFPPDGLITREMVYGAIHPEDNDAVWSAARRAMDPAVRSDESYSYRIKRYDTGEVRWVIGNGVAHFDGGGSNAQPLLYAGSVRDVTERELTRRALSASEERLRLAVDAAKMAVWDLDLETETVVPSPDLNRLLGFPADAQPTLRELRSRYAPGERERLEAEGAAATARGETSLQTRVKYNIPERGEVTYVLRAALAASQKSDARRNRVIGVLYDATDQARAEERINTINGELQHRLKNVANLAGIFARQTWPADPKLGSFLGRIRSLTMSADLMFGSRSSGLALQDVIRRSLEPFADDFDDQFEMDGPNVFLSDIQFSGMALLLHELATNATKHGALSVLNGRVSLFWRVEADTVQLVWAETGGPVIEMPARQGFGLMLIQRGALPPPNRVTLDFKANGLVATIALPLGQ